MDKSRGLALRRGRPVWLDRGAAKPSFPSLDGHREADLVVVGGGITGALVASAFADANVSVSVLESSLVGRGSTAASSALLLQEPDLGLAELTRRYGSRASRRIWELGSQAVRGLVEMLRHRRIACDLVERDAIYYATTSRAVEQLRSELASREKAGFDVEWLSVGALRRATGIAGRGAIRTRGNAQFDPYAACMGLIRAARVSGAEVFERSPVTRIDHSAARVRVHTRYGRIDAARVVVATGYATDQFRPLAGRFRMYHTYVLATRRLNQSERRDLGLGDVMIWDTERPYHYARWTRDHRLLLGGGDRRVHRGQRVDSLFTAATKELRREFESLLPALADIEIQHAWEGLFAMTPDTLPYIGPHARYPRHLFALGYGGNGMTFGFLAARLLLEYWQGRRTRDHELFAYGRMR